MRRARIGLLVLAAILLALPLVLPNAFYFDVVNRMAINAIVVLGLNLLIGFAGQISLGHAGFFGIGAYASAVLTTHFGWSPLAALVAGAVAAALLALAIAPPIFRLRGHYLAMATLGLGIVISIVIRNEATYTGGPDGMPVPPLAAFGFEIDGEREWYWVLAGLLLFSVWACQNLIDSPFGRALRALHGSEVASQVVGVDVTRYKVTIFALSAFFASIVGSLSAHYVGFVTPNCAEFFHSVELLTMVIVGGMASVFGSVVGAVLLTALPQALATIEGWETVAFGVILIVSMIFLPKGLVPTLAAKIGWGR
ncbi:High-affinity branched-chain amino acid transport system permease protein LivH [Rhodoplanes serenus]|uniref:High-affinity branched-chain amino acid transport system permease protein LivH n=1 Tax=Rhodoplanes serenus TaxID=200615 RepID=A0A447D0A5_9BRAD|nr:branched-chain amino acid ABC transporter permease [Rhodoplanes serenus]VCU10990.1 High-affinity branched-chain amino acid transport system permease protein LivH [Rhodoplanes serenus]